MASPSTCTSSVACPIQVRAAGGGTARSAAPSLATRGASKARGAVRVCQLRRRMNVQRVQPDGRLNAGSRFRNRPVGRQEPEQPEPLAQRVAIDPEQLRRLQLVAAAQLERVPQQRLLHAGHHAPVEPAPLRRRFAHESRQRGGDEVVEALGARLGAHTGSLPVGIPEPASRVRPSASVRSAPLPHPTPVPSPRRDRHLWQQALCPAGVARKSSA